MDPRLRIVAIGGSVTVLVIVIELVRRRRLKEEYSVLWLATATVLILLAIWFPLLQTITNAIGAIAPTSTLFFFGLMFVVLMLLHFSVRISALERSMTALVQELALMGLRAAQRGETPLAKEPEPDLKADPAEAGQGQAGGEPGQQLVGR